MKVDISVSLSSLDEARALAWMVEHVVIPLMQIGQVEDKSRVESESDY